MSDDHEQTDMEELRGEEPDALNIKPVPVVVEGPVQAQFRPSECAGLTTRSVSTTPELIAGRDLRRARVLLIAEDQAIVIGRSKNEASGAYAFRWPVSVPYEAFHVEEVWVASQTGTTEISVQIELWSD